MQLLVFCSRPGLFLAGMAHPAIAGHSLTTFNEAQLRTLIADRHISLAVGKPLTAEGVSEFIAEHNPPAKTPAAKTTKTGGAS